MAKAKAKEVEVAEPTFNPETHLVVNKQKFEALMFNLGTSRTHMVVRQGVLNVIAYLLELPGGPAEARDLYSAMMERVMKP